MAVLSIRVVPSSFSTARPSVVRKPAVAGPKPVQTISTRMSARGTAGSACETEVSSIGRVLLRRVVGRLGNHDLRQRLGRAVLGQARSR